jgi:hypothetical protein
MIACEAETPAENAEKGRSAFCPYYPAAGLPQNVPTILSAAPRYAHLPLTGLSIGAAHSETWPSHSPAALHSVSFKSPQAPPNRHSPAQLEDPSHRLSFPHAVVSVARHCGDVMPEQDTVRVGCPVQDGRVIRPRKPFVLHADDIDRGMPPRGPRRVSLLMFSSATT